MDDKFIEILNKKIQNWLKNDKNEHIFLDSYKWFNENFEETEKDKKYNKYTLNEEDKININTINKKYIPNKILNDKQLKDLYKNIYFNETDYKKIKEYLDNLINYNIPSNVNLKNYLKTIDNNTINILIIGSGPIGLYTASYLNLYYEKTNELKNKKIKILILDNRIYEEGIRLPFSRTTSFGWLLNKMNKFIKNIYAWKNIDKNYIYDERIFTHIYHLEYLLYLYVYNNNIPIYFTNKFDNYKKIEDFSKKHNFNYIMDCTGGRLNVNLKPNIKWNLKLKNNDFEIKLDKNEYKLYNLKTNSYHYSYTLVLNLLNYRFKPYNNYNVFRIITDEYHIKLFQGYNNKTITVNDYKKIEKLIKKKDLLNIIQKNAKQQSVDESNIKYIKITLFSNHSHHLNRIAKNINKSLTYITLGNSIGNSEYGIHFGMNSQFEFSEFVSQLIGIRNEIKC